MQELPEISNLYILYIITVKFITILRKLEIFYYKNELKKGLFFLDNLRGMNGFSNTQLA